MQAQQDTILHRREHRLELVASQIELSSVFGIAAPVVLRFYASLIAIYVASHFSFASALSQLSFPALVAIIGIVATLFTLATSCTSFPKIKLHINSYRERAKSLRNRAALSILNAASACICLRTSTRAALASRIERAVLAAASRRLCALSHRARISFALAMQAYLSSIISTRAQTSTLRAAAARTAAHSV